MAIAMFVPQSGVSQRRQRVCCISGVVMIALGICSILFALVARLYIPTAIAATVEEAVVVASPEHPLYADFVSNAADTAAKKYNKLYFYDLQNGDAFLRDGQAPQFVERGPYVFQERYRHHNVTFSEDGSMVTYADAVTNTFVPELSAGTLSDRVTMLNLPYVKVMSRVGSESQLMRAGSVRVMSKALQVMQDKLVPAIQAGATAQAILKAAQTLSTFGNGNGGWDKLMSIMGGNCPDGQCHVSEFFAIKWLAGGDVASLLETGVCACQNCSCTANAIPAAQVARLMNVTDGLAVTNSSRDIGASLWLLADIDTPLPALINGTANSTGISHASVRQQLQSHFNLSAVQFEAVRSWLMRVAGGDFIRSKVFDKLNSGADERVHVADWSDIPARQWLLADVLARLDGGSSTPVSVQPDSPVELPFYFQHRDEYNNSTDGDNAGVPASAQALPWSLRTVQCVDRALRSNLTATLATFMNISMQRGGGVTQPEFTQPQLDEYALPANQTLTACLQQPQQSSPADIGVRMLRGYMLHMAATVMRGQLQAAITAGSGLIVTRTVAEHALGVAEPLLRTVLEPDDPRYMRHALLVNDESLDAEPLCHSTADVDDDYFACRQVRTVGVPSRNGTSATAPPVTKKYIRAPSTYHTGLDDLGRVGQVVDYHGQRAISGVFSDGTTLPVYGAMNNRAGTPQFGYSAGKAFPPDNRVTAKSRLAVLVPTVPAPFYFEGVAGKTETELYGVRLLRFHLPNTQFTPAYPHHAYVSSQPGAMNVTTLKGVQSQLAPAHFAGFPERQAAMSAYGIPPVQHNAVDGNNNDDDSDPYASYVDVEPISGKGMGGRLRMQVIAPTTSARYDLTHPNVHQMAAMPVYWREVASDATPAQAAEFKRKVYGAQQLSNLGFLVGLPVGVCLLFAGVVLTVLAVHLRRHATAIGKMGTRLPDIDGGQL